MSLSKSHHPIPALGSQALCTPPIIPQLQSILFSKLPAELRNEIYRHVFTSNPSSSLTPSAHPLSLLLTCRQINHESTILAFHTHTFRIGRTVVPTFVFLQRSISHLSTQQASAITALMLDVGTDYRIRAKGAADLMANSILIFPNFRYFQLQARRSRKLRHTVLESDPCWFSKQVLGPFTAGRSISWQKGKHWSIDVSQLESSDTQGMDRQIPRRSCKKNYSGSVVDDNIPGVYMCRCDSEEDCWFSATLIQETGRTLTIDTMFHRPDDVPLEWEVRKPAKTDVRLKPGVPPSEEIRTVPQSNFNGVGVMGYAFEADDEYWDDMIRRNGNLGIVLKDWFASAKGIFSRAGSFCGKREEGRIDGAT